MRILIKIAPADMKRSVWAKALPTCSPYFFLTPTVNIDWHKPNYPHSFSRRQWNVTHLNTGLAIATRYRSKVRARKVAGAVAGLPMPWAKLTARKAVKLRSELIPELREWLGIVRDEQDTTPTTTKEHVGKVTRKSRKSLPTARRGKGKK